MLFVKCLIAAALHHALLSNALWIPEELQRDARNWQPEEFVTTFGKRQQSSCGGIQGLDPCGNTFPSDFCCPTLSQCLLLNTTSSITAALCCPAGQDCTTINPVSCDQSAQNATTVPNSQLHSDPTLQLQTCGGKCCPMGYKCQGSTCAAQTKQQAASASSSSSSAPSSTSTTPSSSILQTSTSSPLSTTIPVSDGASITPVPSPGSTPPANTKSFSGKSFAAGFVPGIVLGALVAAGLVLCLTRRRRRKSTTYLDGKHYSAGGDTLTDLGPDLQRRPTFHGRSISEPQANTSMGHRTDFLHSSPSRDQDSSIYGGLKGYAVHVQPPAKEQSTPPTQMQEVTPRSKGWLSHSPFVNQAQSPVPTQSPIPSHLKRGTLHFQISPVRALKKQRSIHSLRRHVTDATTRSNSSRRHRPDHSRSGSTETIKVLMATPDAMARAAPPAPLPLPVNPHQSMKASLASASTWVTSPSTSDDSTPIDEQPTFNDYTPTRPGRNSNVVNVGASLQSPYTPSNYPPPPPHPADERNNSMTLLPPGMAGSRDSAWRNTAMTTFSSMMEKAGWRKSEMDPDRGKKVMKEKELYMGPDPRAWNK